MATSSADEAGEVYRSREHYFRQNLVGQDVEVTLKDGSVIAGNVTSADPNLKLSYCKKKEPLRVNETQFLPRHQTELDYDSDIILIEARDVHDSNSGGEGFTDSEIAGTMSPGQRKELVAADNTWVQTGDGLEDGPSSAGTFDQFAAYRARGGVETYSDELYSTKLDMSRFSAAEIAAAQRVAEELEKKEKGRGGGAGKSGFGSPAATPSDGMEKWGDSALISADELEAGMVGGQAGGGEGGGRGGDAEGNEEALFSAVQPEKRMGQGGWAQSGRAGFAGGSSSGGGASSGRAEVAPYRPLTGQRGDQRGQAGGYGPRDGGGGGGQRPYEGGGRGGQSGSRGGPAQPPLPPGDRPSGGGMHGQYEGRGGGYDNRQQHGHEGQRGFDIRQQQQSGRGGHGPGPAGTAPGGGSGGSQRSWSAGGNAPAGGQQQQQPQAEVRQMEWRTRVALPPSAPAPAPPSAPASSASSAVVREEAPPAGVRVDSTQGGRPPAADIAAAAPSPAPLPPSQPAPASEASRQEPPHPSSEGAERSEQGTQEGGAGAGKGGKKLLNAEAAEYVPVGQMQVSADPPAEPQPAAPQLPSMVAPTNSFHGIPVLNMPYPSGQGQQMMQMYANGGFPQAGYGPMGLPFAMLQQYGAAQAAAFNNGTGSITPNMIVNIVPGMQGMQGRPAMYMTPQQLQYMQGSGGYPPMQAPPHAFIPANSGSGSMPPPRSPAQGSMGMAGPLPPPMDDPSHAQAVPQQQQPQQQQGGAQTQYSVDRRTDGANQLDPVGSYGGRGGHRGGRGGGGGPRGSGRGGGGAGGGHPRDQHREHEGGGHRGGYGARGGGHHGHSQPHHTGPGPLPGKDGRDSNPAIGPPPPIAAPAPAGEHGGEPKKQQGQWASIAAKQPPTPVPATAAAGVKVVESAVGSSSSSSPPKTGSMPKPQAQLQPVVEAKK